MSNKLMRLLWLLDEIESSSRRRSPLRQIAPRAKVLVTVIFLLAMLSMPVERLSELMLFALYPIMTAAIGGIAFGKVARRSLLIAPLMVLIALPNIFYQREAMFQIGEVVITRGWITFFSIIVRGILSLQALMLLVASTGIYQICRALQQLGLPTLLSAQIYMIMRYIRLIVEQALSMQQARAARGFGQKSYPMKMWGLFVGQLLLRSVRRGEEIGQAMASRGFDTQLPAIALHNAERWRRRDIFYTIAWSATLLLLRTLHFAERIF